MDKRRILFFIGLIAMFASLSLFANFGAFEDASWTKLWVLVAMILSASVGLALVFNPEQIWLNVCRYFSGILFVFSGFVKADDPLGSKYKFIDYFEAWGIDDIFAPTALTFGIILSTIELLVGLALLFKLFPKWSSLGALIFMIFFTPITLYLALQQNISGKELVHDCGCFGDALVLTNWQTFVKNLVILIPVVLTFIFHKRFTDLISNKKSIVILSVLTVMIVGLSVHALRHLPPIDFRPYKIGVTLLGEKCSDIQRTSNVNTYQYADFKNLQTGEHQEFDIVNNYPDYTIWEYNPDVPIRIVEEKLDVPQNDSLQNTYIVDNMMFMTGSDDATCDIITDTSYVFMAIHYDLLQSNPKNQSKVNAVYEFAQKQGYAFYGATSSLEDVIAKYSEDYGATYPFVSADDILLKTIVRSNPGLVLMKNGKIIDKWHHNDIPTIEDLQKICK
ncbi:MAG: DoxX family protein [Bacteroidales bacterium]|nr:DoxX family protein [Bacteroidales bacterium]